MKLGFVGWLRQERLSVPTQIAPRRVFGLVALGEDECIAALRLAFIDGASDQVIQGGYCLAGAPMSDEDAPSLLATVEGLKLRTRPVLDFDVLRITQLGRHFRPSSSPARPC